MIVIANLFSEIVALQITVLDKEFRDNKHCMTVGALVSGTPGVTSPDFGSNGGRTIIRGLGGSRMRVLEVGIETKTTFRLLEDNTGILDGRPWMDYVRRGSGNLQRITLLRFGTDLDYYYRFWYLNLDITRVSE